MKILVIGGSYFFGRVFVMQAVKEHEITVANRGTYSMAEFGVRQMICDRRDVSVWQACREDYDVIVDFCAYEKGDVAKVLQNLSGNAGQYIFVSTVDVYRRGTGKVKDETAPLEQRALSGDAGAYIAGKVALEQEAAEECAKRGMACTVLRPAILYGPFNYAPREAAYIQRMAQDCILPHITGAAGRFQFAYIGDAAKAVSRCLGNAKTYGQAYNLCGDEILTYDLFAGELKRAADRNGITDGETEIREIAVPWEHAMAQGIPLPFPVTEEETELCSNEKSKRDLGMEYTLLTEGMAKTYRAFRGVYRA